MIEFNNSDTEKENERIESLVIIIIKGKFIQWNNGHSFQKKNSPSATYFQENHPNCRN